MAQVIADRKDIDFVLFEQLNANELVKHPKYSEFNQKTMQLVVDEARNYAVKEVLPTFTESDRQGVRYENQKVMVPDCFHKPYKILVEGEWIAITEEEQWGGQGFPHLIGQAAVEYLIGANFAFSVYGLAGHGTGKMVEIFGTDKQKELYLKKLYTGEWGGTMVLTEPEAGSDVGNLVTSAKPNGDGTYSISGNKIFITNGDHDLTENIIHPVLARIEGAPAGTKGISLFIVPKIWVNDDGTLGEPNDVVCTGIEHKMGLNGSATCQLAFGSRGQCRGVLLGEENKGMRVMFHMMNEARLAVGAIGLCNASTAYLYSLDYARQRKQGRDLMDFANPEAPMVPIIRHPDVRRMLMWMKAHTEGMRSLIYYGAWCFDQIAVTENDEHRQRCQNMVDFLTPIIKSYCTDRGFDCTVLAVQVYGGYGYTQDYPVEQLLRDSKINSIYEGTNGIQAMDLLGRKMAQKGGALFMTFLEEVQKTVDQARLHPTLAPLATDVEDAKNKLAETAMTLGKTAMSEKVKTAFAHACPFLDCCGDLCMAWMLLWRATCALPKTEGKKDAAFYQGQVASAQYFIQTILPVTAGRMNSIVAGNSSPVDIDEAAFGG